MLSPFINVSLIIAHKSGHTHTQLCLKSYIYRYFVFLVRLKIVYSGTLACRLDVECLNIIRGGKLEQE